MVSLIWTSFRLLASRTYLCPVKDFSGHVRWSWGTCHEIPKRVGSYLGSNEVSVRDFGYD